MNFEILANSIQSISEALWNGYVALGYIVVWTVLVGAFKESFQDFWKEDTVKIFAAGIGVYGWWVGISTVVSLLLAMSNKGWYSDKVGTVGLSEFFMLMIPWAVAMLAPVFIFIAKQARDNRHGNTVTAIGATNS